MRPDLDPLYYEAHVTVEPVFDLRLEQLKAICENHRFAVAELLLQKTRDATPERSNKDSFCTTRGSSYDSLYSRCILLINALERAEFKVWRYKIEAALLDVKNI